MGEEREREREREKRVEEALELTFSQVPEQSREPRENRQGSNDAFLQ